MQSKSQNTLFLIAACAVSTRASEVFAHDGHGLTGGHWHATDALGFIAFGCFAAVAIWLSRRK